MHIFDPKNHHKLDSKERHEMLRPHDTLVNAGLEKGFIGADIGCGTGFFTIPASKIITKKGKIYAFDIQKKMLTYLRMKIDTPNVVPILMEDKEKYKIPLKNKLLDFVLMSFVIHEVEEKVLLLKEAKRILKDSGIIIIIEWVYKDEEMGPPKQDRISQEDVSELFTKAKFTIKETNTINLSHYISIAGA